MSSASFAGTGSFGRTHYHWRCGAPCRHDLWHIWHGEDADGCGCGPQCDSRAAQPARVLGLRHLGSNAKGPKLRRLRRGFGSFGCKLVSARLDGPSAFACPANVSAEHTMANREYFYTVACGSDGGGASCSLRSAVTMRCPGCRSQDMPVNVQGWCQLLQRGAQPSSLVLDDVWDGRVLKAFAGISPSIRSFSAWPSSRLIWVRTELTCLMCCRGLPCAPCTCCSIVNKAG